jgi:hypothetical protein
MKQTIALIALTVFSTGTCGPLAVGNPLKIDQWMMAQTGAPRAGWV